MPSVLAAVNGAELRTHSADLQSTTKTFGSTFAHRAQSDLARGTSYSVSMYANTEVVGTQAYISTVTVYLDIYYGNVRPGALLFYTPLNTYYNDTNSYSGKGQLFSGPGSFTFTIPVNVTIGFVDLPETIQEFTTFAGSSTDPASARARCTAPAWAMR